MDFYRIVDEEPYEPGYTFNPYAGAIDGEYVPGYTKIDYLNKLFGEYDNATEMKQSIDNEGFKLYLDWLVEQGKLPA